MKFFKEGLKVHVLKYILNKEIYLILKAGCSSLRLTGRNISRGEGVVHWDIPCKKLDVPSTQEQPFILSSVWMKEILNALMSDAEQ